MNNLLKGTVVDMEKTFGTLKFVGMGKVTEKRNAQRRNVVVERVYNLRSTVQKGNIEVAVRGNTMPKTFKPLQPVKLLNPVLDTVGQSVAGNGYASYILSADDLEAVK